MKKYILTILLAIVVGCLFGLWYFKGIKKDLVMALSISDTVNAFQVGVYKNYENAIKEKNKYPSAIIINDNEFYRVYIGLSNDGEVTEKLKKYFDSKDYNYYIKKIIIPESFSEDFENYQEVLLQTDEIDVINKKILEEYSKRIDGIYD